MQNDDLNNVEFMEEFKSLVESVKEISEALGLIDPFLLNKEILNSKDVMQLLMISEPTLLKLESQKEIKYKRVGGQKRYLKQDIMNYLSSA